MWQHPGVPRAETLSRSEARRIALAAQGFGGRRAAGIPDRRLLRRVIGRTGLLQLDSVNVLVRAHYRAQAEGGEVRLVIRGAPVRRIFAVTGLDRVIPSFHSLEQALRQSSAAPASALSPASPQVLGS